MARCEVGRARPTFDDEDRHDGVPPVLVHRWTAGRHRWDHRMAHLAAQRRVTRPDLRGYGESDGRAHTIEETAPARTPWSASSAPVTNRRWRDPPR